MTNETKTKTIEVGSCAGCPCANPYDDKYISGAVKWCHPGQYSRCPHLMEVPVRQCQACGEWYPDGPIDQGEGEFYFPYRRIYYTKDGAYCTECIVRAFETRGKEYYQAWEFMKSLTKSK